MDNLYTTYLEQQDIIPSDELGDVLFNIDSSYFKGSYKDEWYFTIPADTVSTYTPLTMQEGLFLQEILTGHPNKFDILNTTDMGALVITMNPVDDDVIYDDFEYTLVGNIILVKNVSYQRVIKLSSVVVEKTYENLHKEVKQMFNEMFYGVDLGETDSLYYFLQNMSKWKKDNLAESQPERVRSSGVSFKQERRSLR